MPSAIVIDDKWITASGLCDMLKHFGITARHAASARDGLAMLKAGRTDVIFLDINMPAVNGFEFLNYIRQFPNGVNLPVFVVTSDDQPETAARARAMGVLDVMIKPVMMDTLKTALKRAGIVVMS